jgi:biofilm protein TabA
MRKHVYLPRPTTTGVCRVMVHACDEGVYVFEFDTMTDGPCSADYLLDDVASAEICCEGQYGILPGGWCEIPDPEPGCQQDWIAPTRIKGRDTGCPQSGQFEQFRDGHWVDVQVVGRVF